MTYCALPCSCSDSSVETVETVHLAVQAKPCHSMGLELTAPTRSKQVVDVHPEAMTQANGGSSSIAGVLLCVVVVAASLMLLPLAGVTVLLAALAGFWWLSTGSSCAAVQMNALTAESVAEAGAVDMDAAQLVEATEKQDEHLGLDPPKYTNNNNRSVTAKRSALAAALQQKITPASIPAGAPVAVSPTTSAAATTLLPAAGQVSNSSSSKALTAAEHAMTPSVSQSQKALTQEEPTAQKEEQQQQQEEPQPLQQQQQQRTSISQPDTTYQPSTRAAADSAPVALTGSAAILAKLRQQRASNSSSTGTSKISTSGSTTEKSADKTAKVTVLYASQTGTGQEIARSIHAECAAKGLPSEVMSMNELGFDNLRPDKTPIVVVIASSTGDGDPPDNSATAYVALKKSWPADRMAGLKYTVLGLGDSNYTRYMHVPRAIKNRFQDLGGVCFYPCAEADEVDGLEDTVDPWVENILKALQQALQDVEQQKNSNMAVAAGASRPVSASTAGTQQAQEAAGAAAVTAAVVAPAAAAVSSTGSVAESDSGAAPAKALGPPAATAGAAVLPAAAIRVPRTSSPTAPIELVDGLAPKDVDLAGVPPLAPCRITLNESVPPAVAAAIRDKEQQLPSREQMAFRDPTGSYSAVAPFWANISNARLLTAEWSDRTVIHVELDLSDSGMRFAVGDAVGVLPCNDPALVVGLLARLGVDGDAVFEVQPASGNTSGQALLNHISWPCTFRHAFTTGTDLTSVPRKSLLRLLAEFCSDEDEKRTLLFFTSRAGREAYNSEIAAAQPSLLDLLRRFPSCQPPVHALLDALPPLAPRMYSLTNAPVAATANGNSSVAVPGATGPRKLQFAFSVVEFDTQYGTRRGVATTWLAKHCRPWLTGQADQGTSQEEAWVPLFLRHAAFFKPPPSLATPLIMIGPGTGVAPFRGFLQQRLADMQAAKINTPGQALLYFGCRTAEEDYLYEEDWQAFLEAGALSKLRVAFSRAQATKEYVQHLLKEDAAEVAKLIASGAHVYVCGDGAAMAKDVHAALQVVLRDQMGMSEAQAAQELATMTKDGRYVRDIWS